MDAIEIFVGTYDVFMLGFKVEQPNKAEEIYVLKQTLASRDHSDSIRCIVSNGNYVATGSADDRAIIYDIKKRSISHILINHEGTINTLGFSPDASHIFAGSDDGSISVTRIGTWATEKVWKNAHKGSAVKHLSIHPSGKLALSIGSDLVLRTWNLIKGRQAYATNLKNKQSLGKLIENVEWSPDGKNFIVSGTKAVEIMSVDEARVVLVVECKSKPCSVCWIDEQYFLIGLESGVIVQGTILSHDTLPFKLFDKRIKGISALGDYLAIITSSGEVALCKIIKGKSIQKICSTNIDCRPTCITLVENVYEAELDSTDVPQNQQLPKNEEKLKTNIKPKVVVEIETGDADSKIVQTTETPSKKRKKSKSSITPEFNTNEDKSEEVLNLNKSKIEDCVDPNTTYKKSKKKKTHNKSLTIEPILTSSTEKVSKKQKRKSVL